MTNWRNFRALDVELQQRAFIVGPNASGKSNLLDAIRFLAEIARPGSGGLQAAIQGRGGFSAIRCLHARAVPHVEIDVWIGNDLEPRLWRYFLQINIVKPEKAASVVEEIVEQHERIVARQKRLKAADALVFSQTLLEQVGASKDFRDLASFLSSCRYLHVVPQIVRDRARARSEGEDPYGGDLLRRMNEMPLKMRSPRLGRISEALKLAVPQFKDVKLLNDPNGVPHLEASFQHWRHHSSKQSEAFFSDGTLRLIGLLWSIAERGGPLLLEEPELSLNDSVVRELPRMFRTMQRLSARQIITTTHSSAILDDGDVGLKEVHRIWVDANGSMVETLYDNPLVSAQVNGAMSIAQAVLPLLRPADIEKLGRLNVAG